MLRIMRLLVCVAGAAALATGPAKHAARPRTSVKAAAAATEQEPLLLRARPGDEDRPLARAGPSPASSEE